jgi:hypothetical protein
MSIILNLDRVRAGRLSLAGKQRCQWEANYNIDRIRIVRIRNKFGDNRTRLVVEFHPKLVNRKP